MPLQNRVLPTGEIVATGQRGTFTGNRGILHGPDKALSRRRWTHHAWNCCTLEWQGRRRDVMSGRKWTELFFLDEAVAFAAGHRPCGYCRRPAFNLFKSAWIDVYGEWPGVKEVDRELHRARVTERCGEQVRFRANGIDLPDGTFVLLQGIPHLLCSGKAYRFQTSGYSGPVNSIGKDLTVLTPAPFVDLLSAGYRPRLHPSIITCGI